MAVANTKSTIVTALDNVPQERADSFLHEGRIQEQTATVEVASADDANSLYRLFRIPSGARIGSFQLKHDALGAGFNDANVGFYSVKDGDTEGVIVGTGNQIADALDLSSAQAQWAEEDEIDAGDCEKRVWELIGLSEDPLVQYDVVVTVITDPAANGTLSAKMQHSE